MAFCSLSLIHFLQDIITAVTDELFQSLVIRVGTERRIHQGPDIAVKFYDAVQPSGISGVDTDPGMVGILGIATSSRVGIRWLRSMLAITAA